MPLTVIPGLSPQAPRHTLHSEAMIWPEKNCYADLWIGLLHGLRLDPHAMLPFVFGIDFEGDQWTFFKPVLDELYLLYGLDVQELNVWQPLLTHAQEHLAAGKLISTEADAFWLPDTAGTDYRHQHSKTTIVLNHLDVERQQLGYFHNAGYYLLEGEDFAQTFRLNPQGQPRSANGGDEDPAFLPLYAEFIRTDRLQRHSAGELAALALPLLRKHLARRPAGAVEARGQVLDDALRLAQVAVFSLQIRHLAERRMLEHGLFLARQHRHFLERNTVFEQHELHFVVIVRKRETAQPDHRVSPSFGLYATVCQRQSSGLRSIIR